MKNKISNLKIKEMPYSKKEKFKLLIKEFHEKSLPEIKERNLKIPKTEKTITLIGPRRSGKTFYFYKKIKELDVPRERIIYVNFEDDRILPLESKDLNELIEAYFELYPENKEKKVFVFFDEIQNIDGWELFIRRLTDKEKMEIFITGSSSKLLSREIATSLRGRTLTYSLYPLSFSEFLNFKKINLKKDFEHSKLRYTIKKELEEYIKYGGFPEVVLETAELKQKILEEYYQLLFYKDIVERFSIRNTQLLSMLTKHLITNVSNIFSVNAYSKTVSNASKETILEYLSHLEEANLIFSVPFFAYSMKRQQINPKKTYCIDNGIRNSVAFQFSKDEGRLVENLVAVELKKKEKEIYYWKNKKEVDFIIKNKDNSLEAINVTYSDDINEREIKGLLEFKQEFKNKVKNLTIITKDIEDENNGIKFIPLWKWLLK